MSGLSRFQSVLDLHQHAEGGLATFSGERVGGLIYITFGDRDFKDLGSPQTITVSVEPGNSIEAEYGEKDELLAAAEELGIDLSPREVKEDEEDEPVAPEVEAPSDPFLLDAGPGPYT